MKFIRYFYLISLLIYSHITHGAMSDIDLLRDRDNVILNNFEYTKSATPFSTIMATEDPSIALMKKRNIMRGNLNDFSNMKCITPASKFEEVDEQFKVLTNHFHYDMDLRYYYVKFLISQGKIEEGLIQFAPIIPTANVDQTTEFMELLKTYNINEKTPKQYIEDINECIMNPNLYANRKKLHVGIRNIHLESGLKKLNKCIEESQKDNVILLLDLLDSQPIIYGATLRIIITTFDQHDHSGTASKIVGRLYYINKEKSSPYLKDLYASRCLIKEKENLKAIQIYEEILEIDNLIKYDRYRCLLDKNKFSEAESYYESDLGEDFSPLNTPLQTAVNFNKLAVLYRSVAPYNKQADDEDFIGIQFTADGLDYIKKSEILLNAAALYCDEVNPIIAANLACIQCDLDKFDQAYATIKIAMNTPMQTRQLYRMNENLLNRNYRYLLQKVGKTDELQEIYRKKNAEILQKNKHLAELIKKAQEHHQKELAHAQQIEQERQQKQQNRKQLEKDYTRTEVEPEAFVEKQVEKGCNKLPEKKVKSKTKGKSEDTPVTIAQETPLPKSIIYIDTITSNKHVIKTFGKLFAKYDPGVCVDKNVKIRMNELENMYEELEIDYAKSKGKGSHTKATLNVEKFGGDAAEQMLIYSQHANFLIPDQIKDTRLAFLKARILPRDETLITILIAQGEL